MGASFLPSSPAKLAQPLALDTWSSSHNKLYLRVRKVQIKEYSYIVSSKRYEVYVQREEEGTTIKPASHIILFAPPSSPDINHIIAPPAYMACTSSLATQEAIVVLLQLRPPQGAGALVVMLKRL